MNAKIEKMLKAIETEETKFASELAQAEQRATDARAALDRAELAYGDAPSDGGWATVERARSSAAQATAQARAAQKRTEDAREKNAARRTSAQAAAFEDAIARCSEATWRKALEPLVEKRRAMLRDLAALELATASLAASHDEAVDEAEALAAELGIDPGVELAKGREHLDFGNGNAPGRDPRRGAVTGIFVEHRARGLKTSSPVPEPVVIVPVPELLASRGLDGWREKVSEFFS
jgi:hypothetical protein